MTLRPFQEELIDRVRGGLRRHKSVLTCLPTGGGKTYVAAHMMRSARAKGLRAWFVAHRDFLIDQTSQTLAAVGVDHAFVAAGWPYHSGHPTQVCSVQTLVNRLDQLPKPDIIFVDEAHHIAAGTWTKVRASAPNAFCVGLTATPTRLDGKGLSDHFGEMVCGPSVSWLIENGFLSRYRAFAPSLPDLAGVHTRMGDYVKGELEDAMDRSAIIGDMVGHYKRLAMGLRAVYFAVSVKHSQHIAATFNAAGIPAAHIDGATSSAERAKIARAMARGEIKILCNIEVCTEGWDLAAQAGMPVTIEAVGLARPTQSLALHLQMVGRALRPKDQPAIILDHAGGLIKHGLPDDDRTWKLEGTAKKAKGATSSVRTCTECFGVFEAGKPKCPYCGHDHKGASAQVREVEEIAGTLDEVDPEALRARRKAEEKAAVTVQDFISLGKARGYKDPVGWAANQLTIRKKYERMRAAGAQKRAEHQAQSQRWW